MQKLTAVLLDILAHIAALEAKAKALGIKFRAFLVDHHMQAWADAEEKAEANIERLTDAYYAQVDLAYKRIVDAQNKHAEVQYGASAAAEKHGV